MLVLPLVAMSPTDEGGSPGGKFMSRESRKHKRYKVEAYVDYTGTEVLLNHRISDLSFGGLRIETPDLEDEGQEVTLVISFPELDSIIEVRGEVVWARKDPVPQMGIKFLNLGPRERQLIQKYLQKKIEHHGG